MCPEESMVTLPQSTQTRSQKLSEINQAANRGERMRMPLTFPHQRWKLDENDAIAPRKENELQPPCTQTSKGEGLQSNSLSDVQ